MPTSEARINANRKNALSSTGPKTIEGKAISRGNALKHGMTGAGIVLGAADSGEVERRNEALQAELAPQSTLGEILVRQLAMLSVRMERSGKQEIASVASRVRHAEDDFDQGRLDEADRLLDLLGEEPRIHLRKLKNSPEGVERLMVAWEDLRADLIREPRPIWTAWHRERAENLTGHRIDEASGSRIGVLSNAIWGDFAGLEEVGEEVEDDSRKVWARSQMVERIDSEISALVEHFETLDFEMIEIDRAEAPGRALFDPSREAALARRYEAEATRGFFKALKELRQVEAEAADRPSLAPNLAPSEVCDPLASSWEKPAPAVREPRPTAGFAQTMADPSSEEAVDTLDRVAFDRGLRTED
jgi:hypothetical protein